MNLATARPQDFYRAYGVKSRGSNYGRGVCESHSGDSVLYLYEDLAAVFAER